MLTKSFAIGIFGFLATCWHAMALECYDGTKIDGIKQPNFKSSLCPEVGTAGCAKGTARNAAGQKVEEYNCMPMLTYMQMGSQIGRCIPNQPIIQRSGILSPLVAFNQPQLPAEVCHCARSFCNGAATAGTTKLFIAYMLSSLAYLLRFLSSS